MARALSIIIAILLLTSTYVLDLKAQEQRCDLNYTVKEGDTLASISSDAYGQSSNWTLIFYSNRELLGDNPSLINVGANLWVPCIGNEISEDETQESDAQSAGRANVKLLTASDYRPFTDQSLAYGGMLTRVVSEAYGNLPADISHSISWVNDWAAHLSPLLADHAFDLGFPWFKPPCVDDPEASAGSECPRKMFHFSDPLFEVLTVYYFKVDDTRPRARAADLTGRKVCRPSGYATFMLEQMGLIPGRTIFLIRPQTVNECFQLLMENKVDLVALNEFTGRAALKDLGLEQDILASDQLASIDALHIIAHKLHPRGRILIHQFNQGLRELRRQGEYEQIIVEHLAEFYGQ